MKKNIKIHDYTFYFSVHIEEIPLLSNVSTISWSLLETGRVMPLLISVRKWHNIAKKFKIREK